MIVKKDNFDQINCFINSILVLYVYVNLLISSFISSSFISQFLSFISFLMLFFIWTFWMADPYSLCFIVIELGSRSTLIFFEMPIHNSYSALHNYWHPLWVWVKQAMKKYLCCLSSWSFTQNIHKNLTFSLK